MAEYIDAIHLATMFSGEGIDLSYNDIVDMINMGDLKGRPDPTTFRMQADVSSASELISKISMIDVGSFTSKRYTFEDVAKKTGFSKRVVSKLFAAGEIPTQMNRETGEQYASGVAIKAWFKTIKTQFNALKPEVQAEFFRTHQPESATPTPPPWEPVVTPTPAPTTTPISAPSALPQAPSTTPMAPPAVGTVAQQQTATTPGMYSIYQVAERYQTTVAEVQSWVKEGILQGTTYTKEYGQKGDWQWEEERTYYSDQQLMDLESVKLAQWGLDNISPEMMGIGWELDEADAAQAIGVDTSEIPNLIAAGQLIGKKVGNKWEVDSRSVTQYMQNMATRMVFADFTVGGGEYTEDTAHLYTAQGRSWVTVAEAEDMLERVATSYVERWQDPVTGEVYSRTRADARSIKELIAAGKLEKLSTPSMYGMEVSVTADGREISSFASDALLGRSKARISIDTLINFANESRYWSLRPGLEAPSDMVKTHLSESDVAQNLGIPERQVEGWIKSGQLEATKVGNRYRITPDAAERFRRDMVGYYGVPGFPEQAAEERDTMSYGEFEDIFGVDPTRLVAQGKLLTERVGGKREVTIASANQLATEKAAIFQQSSDQWMSTNEYGYNVLNLQKIQRRF